MHKHAITAFLSLIDLRRSAKASVMAALTGFVLASSLPTTAPAANVDRLIQGLLGLPVGPAPEPPKAPPRQQRHRADDAAGAAQGGQQAAVQPSFDCRRVKGAAQKTICRVPALAALDVAMAQSYAAARAAASSSADATNQLVQDQRNWRKQRDACGNDADCLQKVIFGRLQELQNPSAAAAGNGQSAPAPAFTQQPDAGINAAGGTMNQPAAPASEVPAAAQAQGLPYAADALVHPGDAGMLPQRLFLWNNLVVLNHPQSPDQESFVDLIILSIRPDYIEEKKAYNDNATYYSNRFLTPENPLRAGERFPGHDEFERRDARNAFLARYADRLRQMAPKLPFQFAYTYEFDLPEYNTARDGFALPEIGSLHLNDTSMAGRQSGGITLRPDYDLPEPLFWPASDSAARQAVEKIRTLANPMSPRRVRLLAVLEATDGKAETLTIGTRLKSLAVYDDGLTTELHSFDVSAFNHNSLSKSDPLAILANPPRGIQPWNLLQVDGHPVIDAHQSDKFFGLVRLGALPPGSLDSYGEAQLAEAYLTKQTRNEVMGQFPNVWKGDDEFAQAQSHQTFQSRYEASIASLAPKAPFDFSFSDEVHVLPYDSGRGAFPVEAINIADRMKLGGLQAKPDFKLPDRVDWKLPSAKAQDMLAVFGQSRTLRAVAHVLVDSVDAVSGTTRYRLDALSLYTPDLRTKLYDFPIRNDAAAYLAAGAPAKLSVASPAPLDSEFLCAELLAAAGAKTPEAEFQRCWQTIATRDQTAYDTGAAGRTGATDANHPFFPRGGAAQTPESRAAFLRWASAYAAGLGDAQLISPQTGETSAPAGKVFAMLQGTAPSGSDLRTLLAAEHYQPDQLLNVSIDNQPALLAFPNRASIYSSTVPLEVLVSHPAPYNARTLFKTGAAKLAATDDGRPLLLVKLEPQSMSVSSLNGDVIYTNKYDQIQPLGDAFTSPSAPVGPSGGPLSLDGGAIDLLTARTVGDKLSKQAMAFMVTRQWQRENQPGAAPADRFFAIGKREPTPKEAAELGPQYIAWAAKEQPSLPARVTLHRQVQIPKGQTSIAWTSLDCFGGIESLSNSMNLLMGINSELGSCERRRTNGQESPQQHSQCIALQATAASLNATQSLTGVCKMPLSLGFADPVSIAFHFDQDLPALQADMLGDSMKADVTLSLDISGATWSQTPPSPGDLLPQEILAALSQVMTLPAPEARQGAEFVTFDARLVGLDVRDEDGKPVQQAALASKPPLAKLIDEFHQSQRATAAPTIASGAYGPDMVGLRLGMNFAEAEAIVRNEMKVGTVLQGRRAFAGAATGQISAPMSSGKLFISEDGLELVALLDEPPSAADRVVAMWRRVYVPGNTVLPEEIFAKVIQKYGPPTGTNAQTLQTGIISGWYTPSGQNCSGLFGAVKAKPLAEDWTNAGAPFAFKSPNSTYPKGPSLSATLYDPMNAGNKTYQGCGPLVTVSLLDAVSIGGPMMELDTTLTDLDRYAAAYDENLKRVRAQAPQGSSTAATKF